MSRITLLLQKIIHRLLTLGTPVNHNENNDPKFYSQYEQDKFVIKSIFKDRKEGIFVDIGAHNGISFSNSYSLEKDYNWSGICVEPMPDKYAELIKNRKAIAINGCISKKNGVVEFYWVKGGSNMLSVISSNCTPAHRERIEHEIKENSGEIESIKINSYTLSEVFEKNKISHVDFLSMDIEGAEMDALRSIDFKRCDISVFAIENNEKNWRIPLFLFRHGYKLLEIKGDEIYIKKSFNIN